MAFEKVHLVGKIECDVEASAAGTVTIQSDIPGNAMADRGTVAIPVCTRRVVAKRLPYQLQGHLFKFSYAPGLGQSKLYGVRVWARELPTGVWQWYKLPVVDTANEWSAIEIPIPETPEHWGEVRIPIPPTDEDWTGIPIDFPGTPENWSELALPIKPTPLMPEWVSLRIDA